MASGVYVYNHDDVDITTTGLVGDLQPIDCIYTEEKNGESALSMRLCYDSLGKWKAVKPGCYIKAKVPVRVPPKIIDYKYSETLTSYRVIETVSRTVTVWESSGAVLDSKEMPGLKQLYYAHVEGVGTEPKPVKYKYTAKAGDIVQLLEEGGEKCKVYSKSFGTGWMLRSNLEEVKTEVILDRFDGVENVTDAVRLQYQLFLVTQVEQNLDGVTVTALHVFYELLPNFTTWKTEEAVEASTAIDGVFGNMLVPDERFTCKTDTREKAGGALDYSQQNMVQALLDPENGICARYGLSLIRDNYDLYALKNVGSDRGFVVEYSKNMLAVDHAEDISEVVTRIVPFGLDASGNAVYLDELFVDSPHIGDYPFPRIQYLDCTDTAVESKEKGKEKTLSQVKAELKARAEAEFAAGCDLPVLSMTVSFISLGDTEEYKQYKDLDKVFLFDKIGIRDKVRGYDYSAEVVAITHNVLTGMLESVTLGSIRHGTGVRKIATWQVPTVDGSNIRLKSIHAGALGDGSIPESALQDGAVTVDKLAAGSVTADKIAAGAISTDFLEAGSIKTEHLESGAVTADKIDSKAIAAIGISAGSITTDKLAAGAVTADKIASGTIAAIGIDAESITTDKLAAGAVTAAKIASGSITANHIASKTITAEQVAAGLITADNGLVGTGAIGTAQIADGSITDAKIVTLTASKLTAGIINAADVNIINLKADNITTGTINGQRIPVLGGDKISDGAISGVKIVNGAVTTDKIDDGAVTAAKVVSEAITTDKLAANAVTANKILAGAVTTDKLAANAVTADKIQANTITANKLASDVGSYLELSSNKAIIGLVRDMDAMPTTHMQFVEPTNVQKGDLWINTGESTWADLKKMTWGGVKESQWGAYLNTTPVTRVWDGAKWQTLADQAVVEDQYTQINQTKEQISQMATKTELSSAEQRISTAEEKIKPDAIINTVTQSTQYKTDLNGKASADALDDVEERVSTAEEVIKPDAIIQTVTNSTKYKDDLADKVSQSYFKQEADKIIASIEEVDEKAGKTPTKVVNTALTLDTNGIDMQGGQINIRAGSALTVDAPNFNLDAAGNAVMKNASVSGNLTNNGIAVLTAKNLVVSSTQPTAPVPGMVWVKPVGSTAATFLYNNTTVQSFKAFETAHTMQNAGTAVSASGSYTYNVKIPYKVTGTVNATRYLTMMVGNTAIFADVALEKTAGTYVLELSGNLSAWLGNSNSLSFTLNLHYMGGDDGTLHNVHRVDVGAIDLKLYAKSNAASGWSGTEVQVYNG